MKKWEFGCLAKVAGATRLVTPENHVPPKSVRTSRVATVKFPLKAVH